MDVTVHFGGREKGVDRRGVAVAVEAGETQPRNSDGRNVVDGHWQQTVSGHSAESKSDQRSIDYVFTIGKG